MVYLNLCVRSRRGLCCYSHDGERDGGHVILSVGGWPVNECLPQPCSVVQVPSSNEFPEIIAC